VEIPVIDCFHETFGVAGHLIDGTLVQKMSRLYESVLTAIEKGSGCPEGPKASVQPLNQE
jgi:hypothetical protein